MDQLTLKTLVSYDPVSGEMMHLKNRRGVPKDRKIKTVGSQGYLVVWLQRVPYLVHRLAFLYMDNTFPKVVDHKDGNKLNNSFSNLRNTNHSGNNQNKVKATSRSKLNILGVSLIKKSGKYGSFIYSNGKNKNLGVFDTKEEASNAYWKAKNIYHLNNFFNESNQ